MFRNDGVAHERHCVVWREVMLVIFENNQAERIDQAVCGISGDEIHLFFSGSLIRDSEIHDSWRIREPKTIGLRQACIAILSFDEFIPEAGCPMRRLRSCI